MARFNIGHTIQRPCATTEKFAIVEAAFSRGSAEADDYPAPDLAIEIDLSGPGVDRPGIYARLRVTEIWRFGGKTIVIERLREDASYAEVKASWFLPMKSEEILRWLIEEDYADELAWERRLEQWARRLRRRPT